MGEISYLNGGRGVGIIIQNWLMKEEPVKPAATCGQQAKIEMTKGTEEP